MEITYFRLSAKENKKGLAPIWARITHNNQRANISTGIDILAHQWNQDTQTVINTPLADSYNNAIVQLTAKVYDCYTALKRKDSPVTAAAIKLLATKEVEAVLFTRVIDEYQKARLKDTETEITQATYKGIVYKLNNIRQFLKDTRNSNILAAELSAELLDNYRRWLRTTLGSTSDQYANKCLYQFTELERFAYSRKYIHRLNLLTYTVAKGFGDAYDEVPHVTELELKAIEDFTPKHPALQKVKDLFLWQCYTGMAYADSQLYNSNMIHYHDGIPFIKYYRKKIRKRKALATPLLSTEAKAISDKYNGTAPRINLTTYNEWLKMLQAYCNITTTLSSHVGRKTFGMRMLNTFGFKMEEVSRMLGHSSVKMTEKVYAKVTLERVITSAYSNNIAA